MDWIEQIFHVSPDEGNGSLELLCALAPAVALLTGILGVLWFRRRHRKRADRH
jgi:hypothetical protein